MRERKIRQLSEDGQAMDYLPTSHLVLEALQMIVFPAHDHTSLLC